MGKYCGDCPSIGEPWALGRMSGFRHPGALIAGDEFPFVAETQLFV
jgi:hypothetical protein